VLNRDGVKILLTPRKAYAAGKSGKRMMNEVRIVQRWSIVAKCRKLTIDIGDQQMDNYSRPTLSLLKW